ncbi:primase subunit of DNA polymerase alpha [Haematococcus lacustris]
MSSDAATKRQKVGEGGEPMEEAGPPPPAAASVQDLMHAYYARLFPHQHMYRWLAYGNDSKHPQADPGFFNRREFCFTMDGDIFVRYQAFKDGTDMADAIRRRCPSKIDLGPVYSYNPQNRLSLGAQFHPVERELVFDIDLTDYDDVRTCGKEGHICTRCWPLMAVAIKIIDRGLREDFGFCNILWVYSGRRGVHCWVCDPSARKLSDEARAAIANYFAVYKGHEGEKAKVALGGGGSVLHPAVDAAAQLLRPAWEEHILPSQGLLEDEGMVARLLKHLPDEETVKAVRSAWSSKASNRHSGDLNLRRWKALEDTVANRVAEEKRANNVKLMRQLERCCNEIMFVHAYPRLDMEVSKKMNHLLKAPFCVHPKTGKVCVPLAPEQADAFDPDTVPTVQQLLAELPPSTSGAHKGLEEWQSTRLAEAVQLFESHFLEGCLRSGREQIASKSKALVAASGMTLAY